MESKIEKIEIMIGKEMCIEEEIQNLYENYMELVDKTNQIIDHLNSQSQPEENEPEKVYVEPIEFNHPENTARVEWKSREEIADNLQAQFEYGRWGIAKDLEAASKGSKKDEDKIALETYKQATQDTPEEWEELTKEEWFMLKLAVNEIHNKGNGAYDEISRKIDRLSKLKDNK